MSNSEVASDPTFDARYRQAVDWAIGRAEQCPGVRFTAAIGSLRLTCWRRKSDAGPVRYETRLDFEEEAK